MKNSSTSFPLALKQSTCLKSPLQTVLISLNPTILSDSTLPYLIKVHNGYKQIALLRVKSTNKKSKNFSPQNTKIWKRSTIWRNETSAYKWWKSNSNPKSLKSGNKSNNQSILATFLMWVVQIHSMWIHLISPFINNSFFNQ